MTEHPQGLLEREKFRREQQQPERARKVNHLRYDLIAQEKRTRPNAGPFVMMRTRFPRDPPTRETSYDGGIGSQTCPPCHVSSPLEQHLSSNGRRIGGHEPFVR